MLRKYLIPVLLEEGGGADSPQVWEKALWAGGDRWIRLKAADVFPPSQAQTRRVWNHPLIVLDFFLSISLSLCCRELLCTSTCQLLAKWGYSVSLSTVNFNNLLEGPLTVSFYHIINDDSIFLCHSISSWPPALLRPCNEVQWSGNWSTLYQIR